MPHADLPTYRDGFFEKFLADLPGAPTVAQIEEQQPAGQPAVLMGDYVEYSGPALTPLPNSSITPQFAIRVDAGGTPQTYVMLWVVERFDVASDSQETIARILADFRPAAATGSSEAASISADLAATWSQALARDVVRQALARNLSEITAVPGGLPAGDLETLRAFLGHFGTYKTDGTYYAKGTIAEGTFPAGVSDAYLAADTGNLAEVKLRRDLFYCYALVTERLWNPQAAPTRFRQLVYRIEDRGADAPDRWRLALIHTVAANQAGTAPFSRFIFFQSGVGLGLAISEAARMKLDPTAAALLEQLPALLSDLPGTLANPSTPIVGTAQSPYVLFIGAVTEAFPATELPEGVIADGDGAVRIFRCPPQHAMALAERADIENLELSGSVWPCMQQAMVKINLAGRSFPAGITAANTGQGVVVGIVDSGIDGGHPAFLGRSDDATKTRIHSVWNLWESGGDSPWVRGGNNAAYRSMNFGREYIGHDEVTTTVDRGGHGTHCSGIAAGRAFGTWPGGIAPAATIVVASIGHEGGFVNDVVVGVKYCFQKAAELGLPCVVNISQGTERHSHDGTDPLSVALTQLVSQDRIPAVGSDYLLNVMPSFIEGRIICAAAGNLRGKDLHWQATIPAGGEVSVLYQPFGMAANTNPDDGVTFWAYNEDATTVRLRISTRHSSNAVLATPEVPLMSRNRANSTDLAGGLRVNIHNGPQRPNNNHFSPEIYWLRPAPAAAVASAPWIIRLRNEGRAPCVIHGFGAFREKRGRFIFADAQTTALIGVTYTADQKKQFESHKISTPGTSSGAIGVAAFTSRLGGFGTTVDEIAPFSSPGPLRAVGPGRRGIDVTMPGDPISSAKAWTAADPSRGVTDKSGTSMACPMMAGVVAYLLQMNRRLTTGQIRTRIEMAATRRATDSIDDWGLGRLDVSKLQP